eukprot:Gb_16758 [translate_table: standard]
MLPSSIALSVKNCKISSILRNRCSKGNWYWSTRSFQYWDIQLHSRDAEDLEITGLKRNFIKWESKYQRCQNVSSEYEKTDVLQKGAAAFHFLWQVPSMSFGITIEYHSVSALALTTELICKLAFLVFTVFFPFPLFVHVQDREPVLSSHRMRISSNAPINKMISFWACGHNWFATLSFLYSQHWFLQDQNVYAPLDLGISGGPCVPVKGKIKSKEDFHRIPVDREVKAILNFDGASKHNLEREGAGGWNRLSSQVRMASKDKGGGCSCRRKNPQVDVLGPSSYRGKQNVHRLAQEIADNTNSRIESMEATINLIKEEQVHFSETLQTLTTASLHIMHTMAHMTTWEEHQLKQFKSMKKSQLKLFKVIWNLPKHFIRWRKEGMRTNGFGVWLGIPKPKLQQTSSGKFRRSHSI